MEGEKTNVIKIGADASEFERCVNELVSNIDLLPDGLRETAREIGERLLQDGFRLVEVQTYPAFSASRPVLLFKPSKLMLDFCAAVRTRDFDRFQI